jgi:hypothetical protein
MSPLPPAPPAIVFTLPARPQLCLPCMVEVIRQVENWKPGTVGRAGERGYWQLTPGVWRRYSRSPQWSATEEEQRCTAAKYLADIRAELIANGVPETPFFIALAYGAGVKATMRRTMPAAKLDYAQRAENLYLDGVHSKPHF